MKELKTYNNCTKGESLNFQASDWAMWTHILEEAVVKGHEKYLGCRIQIGERIEKAIEQYILELGIAIDRYDPVLKIYLEDKGYVFEQ
jgi:hypothetical protein